VKWQRSQTRRLCLSRGEYKKEDEHKWGIRCGLGGKEEEGRYTSVWVELEKTLKCHKGISRTHPLQDVLKVTYCEKKFVGGKSVGSGKMCKLSL